MIKSKEVAKILEKYPETRNDDRLLYVTYLEEYFWGASREAILYWPSPASIVRIRAEYQNEQWSYLAIPEVRKDRAKKAAKTRIKRSSLNWLFKNLMSKIS